MRVNNPMFAQTGIAQMNPAKSVQRGRMTLIHISVNLIFLLKLVEKPWENLKFAKIISDYKEKIVPVRCLARPIR